MINTLSQTDYPVTFSERIIRFSISEKIAVKVCSHEKNTTFEAYIQYQSYIYENRTPHLPFPTELRML